MPVAILLSVVSFVAGFAFCNDLSSWWRIMSRSRSAIVLHHVTKTYRLYGSPGATALGVAGLRCLLPRSSLREFPALDGVSLQVNHGERVAIIGRNGAGKTTLLRLVQGLHRATAGEVRVDGRVQALMDVGVGFHPDFSGFETSAPRSPSTRCHRTRPKR